MMAITANNISKKFRIPHQKKTTLFQRGIGFIRRQEEFEEFWAVKNVSFDIDKGETFGIIGKNGSGKSTMLKLLARVLYPDTGIITTEGRVAPFLELGVGFQPELSAVENIYIYSAVLGVNRRAVDAVREQIFEFAELKKFADMKLKNFSSGMYLRLAFSTAIYCIPDIILIDEVLAVGDELFQKKCIAKINEFKKDGKTIVFVSHNLGQVEELCERSLLMDGGGVTAIDTTKKVISEYRRLLEGSIELDKVNNAGTGPNPLANKRAREDVSCRVIHSVAQCVPPSKLFYLHFDTAVWDTHKMHDNADHNSRLTCTVPGTYVIYANVEFDVNGIGMRGMHIRMNGHKTIASQHNIAVSNPGIGTTLNISCVQYLDSGDYLELGVTQSSGQELNINSKSEYSPVLGMTITGQ